jgi:hypothetical protein
MPSPILPSENGGFSLGLPWTIGKVRRTNLEATRAFSLGPRYW